MNDDICVIKNRRTLRYEVKYVRLARSGPLHRTIECGSAGEAAGAAIDIKRKRGGRIVAGPEVMQYIRPDLAR